VKFLCDQCGTKYSIDDSRVRGKMLKVRCKACSNLITVCDPAWKPVDLSGPVATPVSSVPSPFAGEERTVVSSAPVAPPAADKPEWFLSFSGDQEGPHTLEQARARVRAVAQPGFAWRDGFPEWLPVERVAELSAAAAGKAGPKTIDLSPLVHDHSTTIVASEAPAASVAPAGGGPRARVAEVAPRSADSPSMHSQTALAPVAEPIAAPQSVAAAETTIPSGPTVAPAPVMVTSPLPAPIPTPAPSPVAAPVPSPLPSLPDTRPMANRPGNGPIGNGRTNGAAERLAAALAVPDAPASSTVAPEVWHAPAAQPTPWLKWALGASAGVIVLLLGAVGYLLWGRPAAAPPPAPAPVAARPAAHFDDQPVAVPEAAPPAVVPPVMPTAPHVEAAKSIAPVEKGAAHAHAGAPAAHAKGKGGDDVSKLFGAPGTRPGLSSRQSDLAKIYGDEEKAPVTEPLKLRHEEAAPTHEPVSDAQIRGVVTRNMKSLTSCFERVLRHGDESLKNARVDVDVKIGISGSVTKVSYPDSRYANSEIGACLAQTIRRWHFPPQDREYQTSFPLLLQAQ